MFTFGFRGDCTDVVGGGGGGGGRLKMGFKFGTTSGVPKAVMGKSTGGGKATLGG